MWFKSQIVKLPVKSSNRKKRAEEERKGSKRKRGGTLFASGENFNSNDVSVSLLPGEPRPGFLLSVPSLVSHSCTKPSHREIKMFSNLAVFYTSVVNEKQSCKVGHFFSFS